ncbi:unnamed protein product [Alternaria alternata]
MHFLSILLLCTQSILATTSLGDPSDKFISTPAITRYTVEATDHTKTAEIQAQLKNLYGDDNVVINDGYDGASWTITSEGDDITKNIEALDSVCLVHRGQDRCRLSRRDEQVHYIVFPKLPDGSTDTNATEEFLRSKIPSGSEIYHFSDNGQITAWWGLSLDDDAKKAVENHEGVEKVIEDPGLNYSRALPRSDEKDTLRTPISTARSSALDARSGMWEKQEAADDSLVYVSQFEGIDVKDKHDYVHIPDPGEGIYVYVIDSGVNIDVKSDDMGKEFITDNGYIIQTPASLSEGRKAGDDDAPPQVDSHGTKTASKAVGKKFGVAKKVASDVLKISADLQLDRLYNKPIRDLFALGVPLVVAAGNEADPEPPKKGALLIDTFPGILKTPDLPIINVGASNRDRGRIPFSQYGPLVDVYALGYRIRAMTKVTKVDATVSGTSFAAPQVAGVIATYLSHAETSEQWNGLTGVKRVQEIQKYLISDNSSWIKSGAKDPDGYDLRVVWNGAKEEDHKSSGANGYSDSAAPEPAPAQPQGKALTVILQKAYEVTYGIDHNPTIGPHPLPKIEKDIWSWRYFATDQGVSKLCDLEALSADVSLEKDPRDSNKPPFPTGTVEMKDLHGQDCTYKNADWGNPGTLWCSDVGIACRGENMKNDAEMKDCGKIDDAVDTTVYQQPVVVCEW